MIMGLWKKIKETYNNFWFTDLHPTASKKIDFNIEECMNYARYYVKTGNIYTDLKEKQKEKFFYSLN